MKVDMKKLHVKAMVIPALFQTPHVKDEVLRAAWDGVQDLNLLITEILDQECNPLAIRLEDVADTIGSNAREMRSNIKKAMKVARDRYDGIYDPPAIIEVDRLLYMLTTIIIADDGRMSDDVVKYVVRTNMDAFFDTSRLENEHDFACYVALIDYFETCLLYKKLSITAYLKQHGNALISSKRMLTYLKKNWWYGDPEETQRIFTIDTEAPSLPDILKATEEILECLIDNTVEANFNAYVD